MKFHTQASSVQLCEEHSRETKPLPEAPPPLVLLKKWLAKKPPSSGILVVWRLTLKEMLARASTVALYAMKHHLHL